MRLATLLTVHPVYALFAEAHLRLDGVQRDPRIGWELGLGSPARGMDRVAPTETHAYVHNCQKVYEWNQTLRCACDPV